MYVYKFRFYLQIKSKTYCFYRQMRNNSTQIIIII